MQNQGKIKVPSVIVAHLIRGLYRSNATTFKELVSNAFDADATEVRIDTNFPEFDFLSCVDNGKGMSKEIFLRHFNEKGIGSSTKRKGDNQFTPIYHRPIIGRLGIGMLAIGQLCHSFEIESHYLDEDGKGQAYHAVIILEDEGIKTVEEQEKDSGFIHGDLEVGTWQMTEIEYEEEKKGLSIITNDVRATFRREMKQSLEKNGKSLIDKIRFNQRKINDEFFSVFENNGNKSILKWNTYLETIWELSILCPLPYYEDSNTTQNEKKIVCPIDFSKISQRYENIKKFIEERQQQLKNYMFKVTFDGIDLKRLISLPSSNNLKPDAQELHLIDFDQEIYGRRLRFTGYIFAQVPLAIIPWELNGIQIRLKEVGIGKYDPSFLKYHEEIATIRSKWISGEIFVDEGLEAALTINRDSFNEHEEHYKKLQKEIHKHIHSILSEANNTAKKLSLEKKVVKTQLIQTNITNLIEEQTNNEFTVEQISIPENDKTVILDATKNKIIINIAHRNIKKETSDALYKTILAAYEVSKQLSANEEEQKLFFETTLKKIIQKLI
ncbi:MAG: ATP-binding protein [Saprospiraceae bacterium]|nr:ATP-binding protein [Saprospiraceae bacterium]